MPDTRKRIDENYSRIIGEKPNVTDREVAGRGQDKFFAALRDATEIARRMGDSNFRDTFLDKFYIPEMERVKHPAQLEKLDIEMAGRLRVFISRYEGITDEQMQPVNSHAHAIEAALQNCLDVFYDSDVSADKLNKAVKNLAVTLNNIKEQCSGHANLYAAVLYAFDALDEKAAAKLTPREKIQRGDVRERFAYELQRYSMFAGEHPRSRPEEFGYTSETIDRLMEVVEILKTSYMEEKAYNGRTGIWLNGVPLQPRIKRPYEDMSTEELLLRFAIVGSMQRKLFNRRSRSGESSAPFTLAELLIGTMETMSKFPPTRKIAAILFKRTAMRIFFGGETLKEAMDRSRQLLEKGISVIVDYAAPENVTGNLSPDHFAVEVPKTYEDTLTACAALQKEQRDRGKMDTTVSVALKISTLYEYEKLKELCIIYNNDKEKGTQQLEQDPRYQELLARFERIAEYANDQKVRLYVDAELTEINPLIRKLCYDVTDKDIPLVMTVQAYLQEANSVVDEILERNNERLGVKLVRGAYMGPNYADEAQYRQPDKQHTDDAYNALIGKLEGHVKTLTLATHNEESMRRGMTAAHDPANSYTRTDFATLLGMGDGYEFVQDMQRSKYVPFPGQGSVLGALAYFARRGIEFAQNPVGDGKTRGELELKWITDELSHRSIPDKVIHALGLPFSTVFNGNMLFHERSAARG